MIIPSIDISGGRVVQLIGGEELAIEAGDPSPILERFSIVGEVAVIDIDAARGEGDNSELIAELCAQSQIRVGGGIRDLETARKWLDLGAARVILGTAATPDLLAQLPKERVMVALDSRDGEVVSHGWRRGTGMSLLPQIEALTDLCGGFLVTFVELEGRLDGTDLDRAEAVATAAGETRVTLAGGITTAAEIAALDSLGMDAQVGMALYTGDLSLADSVGALLTSDRPDGLWPTVVTDETGKALGLAWSDRESLTNAIDSLRGVYHSRSRGLWVKGETSGATQELLAVDVDCDRDALRFTVRQNDGFCHTGSRTCWGEDSGIGRLARRLAEIERNRPEGNTSTLLADSDLLAAKIREEADELAQASTHTEVIGEVADVIYFALVKAAAAGVSLEDVEAELAQREARVSRRPMKAKKEF